MTIFHKLTSSVLIGLAISVVAGCAPSGPTRYEVTGKATYAGKPIPAGQIVFESQKGADEPGVMGMAAIKNGQYRSLPEKGPASGPQIVRIAGFEGHENAPPEILEVYPQGKPVFQEYTTKIELPKENTSMDFDVPAQR